MGPLHPPPLAKATHPDKDGSPSLTQLLNRFTPPDHLYTGMRAQTETQVRYGYRVGTLNLLVPLSGACEVLTMQSTTRLPRTPPWLLGMLNVRGNLLPLFDLRRALGLDAASRAQQPFILVLGKASRALGIVIDAQPQALKALQPSASMPPVHERLRPHIGHCHVCDGQIWLDFHHDSFFEQLAGHVTEHASEYVSGQASESYAASA